MDRSQHRCFYGLDRVVLIVSGRSGTGKIVDFIDLEKDWLSHIVSDQFEVRVRKQVDDIFLLAGEEIVQTDHIVAPLNEPIAQVRAEKSSSAGNQYALDCSHDKTISMFKAGTSSQEYRRQE